MRKGGLMGWSGEDGVGGAVSGCWTPCVGVGFGVGG